MSYSNGSKESLDLQINPDQFSAHFVSILRAMGFIHKDNDDYVRVQIKGIEGLIPIRVEFQREERMVSLDFNAKNKKEKLSA